MGNICCCKKSKTAQGYSAPSEYNSRNGYVKDSSRIPENEVTGLADNITRASFEPNSIPLKTITRNNN